MDDGPAIVPDLLRRALRGDSLAQQSVYQTVRNWVQAQLRYFPGISDEHEDVVDEVFMSFWGKAVKGEEMSNHRAFVQKSAWGRALSRARVKRARRQALAEYHDLDGNAEDSKLPGMTPEADADADDADAASRVIWAAGFLQPGAVRSLFEQELQSLGQGHDVDEAFYLDMARLAESFGMLVRRSGLLSCLLFLQSEVVGEKAGKGRLVPYYTQAVHLAVSRIGQRAGGRVLADAHMVTHWWPGWPATAARALLRPARQPCRLGELRNALRQAGLLRDERALSGHLSFLDQMLSGSRNGWPPAGIRAPR